MLLGRDAEQVQGRQVQIVQPCNLSLISDPLHTLHTCSVGAPMAGTIIEVAVKPGALVTAGQQLAVMSAMKMETAVCAPVGGLVTQVDVARCSCASKQ